MLVKKFVLVGDKMSQLRQLFRNRRLVIVAGTTEVGKRRRTFYILNFNILSFFLINHMFLRRIKQLVLHRGARGDKVRKKHVDACGTAASSDTSLYAFSVVGVDHSVGSGSQQFDVRTWHQFGGFWKFGTWRRTRTSVC